MERIEQASEEAFDRWWRASKYQQVVYLGSPHRQIALDGWRAALSALEAEGGTGWRSMDSAPKDGTKVLLWLYGKERGEPVVARWYAPWSNWQAGALPHDPVCEEHYGIGSLVPVAWSPITPPAQGGSHAE